MLACDNLNCDGDLVDDSLENYECRVKRNGVVHSFVIVTLPVRRCSGCGEIWFTQSSEKCIEESLKNKLNEGEGNDTV